MLSIAISLENSVPFIPRNAIWKFIQNKIKLSLSLPIPNTKAKSGTQKYHKSDSLISLAEGEQEALEF